MPGPYTRPTQYSDFCLTGTRTQPPSGEINTGYAANQRPPAEEHNYLFGTNGDWVRWLDQLTQQMLAQQGYDFTVGAGGQFADLNAAMASSLVQPGARLLIISSLALTVIQQITKNNISIACLPNVAITDGGAGTGIQISAAEVNWEGGKFAGFTTTAFLIDAGSNYTIIGKSRFVNTNTADITDNNNKGSTYAIINE